MCDEKTVSVREKLLCHCWWTSHDTKATIEYMAQHGYFVSKETVGKCFNRCDDELNARIDADYERQENDPDNYIKED